VLTADGSSNPAPPNDLGEPEQAGRPASGPANREPDEPVNPADEPAVSVESGETASPADEPAVALEPDHTVSPASELANAVEPDRPVVMTRQRFDELVSDALDQIPAPLTHAMDNVVVLVEDEHPDDPDLLGLYEGVALTERSSSYAGVLPDRITVYRDPVLAVCADEDEVVHEVLVTVVHEVAHHFGLDDDALHELGWG
jgi:predicted Zn-dependent protease with MMP-like domain